MYIRTSLLVLAWILPYTLAHTNQIPINTVLPTPAQAVIHKNEIQNATPDAVKYINTLEQEFTTYMATHKKNMKSHLESLAEILGVEMDDISSADLEGLLSTVVLVLGNVEIEGNRRGGDEVREGSKARGNDKEKTPHPKIGDVEEKLEVFVRAMGIVEGMRELHVALNVWLVGMKERIRVVRGEVGRG